MNTKENMLVVLTQGILIFITAISFYAGYLQMRINELSGDIFDKQQLIIHLDIARVDNISTAMRHEFCRVRELEMIPNDADNNSFDPRLNELNAALKNKDISSNKYNEDMSTRLSEVASIKTKAVDDLIIGIEPIVENKQKNINNLIRLNIGLACLVVLAFIIQVVLFFLLIGKVKR